MIGNPTQHTDAATYSECIGRVVSDLGTATPNIQVLKLMAWLFNLPVSTVRADCQTVWIKIRSAENQVGR